MKSILCLNCQNKFIVQVLSIGYLKVLMMNNFKVGFTQTLSLVQVIVF